MIDFPCQPNCACCCKKIGMIVSEARGTLLDPKNVRMIPIDYIITKTMADFPHGFDEHGKCDKLNADNTCSVYSTRPLICNVKRMFKKYYSKVYSYKQFISVNVNLCSLMRNEING